VIVVENTIKTTFAARSLGWTNPIIETPALTRVVMPVVTDRPDNYISSTRAAADALRPDHSAAKQAAPPRGNPR
jgi:hypothetical protein